MLCSELKVVERGKYSARKLQFGSMLRHLCDLKQTTSFVEPFCLRASKSRMLWLISRYCDYFMGQCMWKIQEITVVRFTWLQIYRCMRWGQWRSRSKCPHHSLKTSLLSICHIFSDLHILFGAWWVFPLMKTDHLLSGRTQQEACESALKGLAG